MISAQSRQGRRIIASLDRGSDLFEALRSICIEHDVRCGDFRGTGSLELAEVTAYDQAQQKWKPKRPIEGGGLELVQLVGNLSEENDEIAIVARATLMRDRDAGVEIVGGRLLRARVFSVELVIESFDDLVLRRFPDVATGLDLWKEVLAEGRGTLRERPTDTEPTADDLEPVRPQALREVQNQAQVPAPQPEPVSVAQNVGQGIEIAAGDVIVHPKFRRCVVQRVEGNEFVQVRLRNGRVVRLSLEVIELTPNGTEDGQRIFEASIA